MEPVVTAAVVTAVIGAIGTVLGACAQGWAQRWPRREESNLSHSNRPPSDGTVIELGECRLARDHARDLAHQLEMQQVDASGADLSNVEIEHLDALSGTIWTNQTTWPPRIADQVLEHSREISPGVYQVIRGNEPNHASLTLA